MSLTLDDPVILGPGRRVAALCRVTVGGAAQNGVLTLHASKTPIAILMERDGMLEIHGLDDRSMTREAVEALCPGVLSMFAPG